MAFVVRGKSSGIQSSSLRTKIRNLGIPDFTAPYRPWLEGMKMLEGVYTRTEMAVDNDQVGDLKGGTLITLCYAYSNTATK